MVESSLFEIMILLILKFYLNFINSQPTSIDNNHFGRRHTQKSDIQHDDTRDKWLMCDNHHK